MWTGARGFVPEGLDEGSLAVYCLDAFKRGPSRRVRSELVCWQVHHSRLRNVASHPITPFPTGRVRFLALLAVNCQATFI